MPPDVRLAVLTSAHRRDRFDCGIEPLNTYLATYASQDVRKGASRCYVLLPPDGVDIIAFYTLSAGEIALAQLPAAVTRKLARYPSVPVARIGRLAVDRKWQGQGLASLCVVDAARRMMAAELGISGLTVDAKDKTAAGFYQRLGFVALTDNPLTLFRPLTA